MISFTIEPWMCQLGLKSDALLVYAYIYCVSMGGYHEVKLGERELEELRELTGLSTALVSTSIGLLIKARLLEMVIGEQYAIAYMLNIDTIRDRVGDAYDERKR